MTASVHPEGTATSGIPLPVLLFVITLGVEIIGWIGTDNLVSFIHPLTTIFSSSPNAKAQRALKKDILTLRAELASTSSQQEFAKWAKIRRKLDKGVADLEGLQAQTSSSKASFARLFKAAIFVLTTVMPFIVSSWHRKEAVFYLPPGWFGKLGWWFSLPSAPAGGIACGVWTMACKRTISSVKDLVVDNWASVPVGPTPVPVPAGEVPADFGESEKKQKREKDEL